MKLFHPHLRRQRARGALLVVLLCLGALGLSFFRAQVLRTASYAVQSDANRLRPLSVVAPRGTIYDRDGDIVADNIPGYTLIVLPTTRDSLRSTLETLRPIADMGDGRVEAVLERHREFPNQPLVVSSDLTFDQVSTLAERRAFLPGVVIETRPKRRYPAGPAVGHVAGFVGEVSREELDQPEYAGYEPGQVVGKTGVEHQYESILGGTSGIRYVEVSALGRTLSEVTRSPEVEPTPGEDLTLHIDLDLQTWIHRIFRDAEQGAVVALDPKTGQVLALYSKPGFDPNEFVRGVAPERWRKLAADSTDPLVNRATVGRYAPGSTFKLATAAVGLKLGLVDPKANMPIPCRGGMQYGNRYFRCWKPEGHGYLDLPGAIKHSCNVYFYQLGVKIGIERFLEHGTRLGFSRKTGIDLPTENAGFFPSNPDWYEERFGWAPSATEVLNLAIGQGPNDQTALTLAHFYAALANGGRAAAPSVAATAARAPGRALDLDLSESDLGWLLEGLRGVVEPGGTAHLASLEHWEVMGKTGTAQNSRGKDHAWFVAIAGPEGEDASPEVVVSVILENGEESSRAAQYAAKVADYYLREKHGMSTDTIQTLREHLMAGEPAPWAEWE